MAEPWSRHLGHNDHIGCVSIVGGTHGNERNGVYLGRNYAKVQGPAGSAHGYNFDLKVIESNVEATKKNLRYVEEDLNRQFACKDLDDPERVTLYEHRRAKEINCLIGPKTSPTPVADVVLDLHNTTASTGVALFLHPRDKFAQELAAYLQQLGTPPVRVAFWADRDVVLLPSVGRSGMTLEVGPVSIGCLDAKLYNDSRVVIDAALAYMKAHNLARKRASDGTTPKRRKVKLDCIQMIKQVPFPRDESKELTGMIHPNVDGNDFSPLRPTDAVFSMFDGTEKTLGESVEIDADVVYPFLVNETSYYEKDIAFMIGRQVSFEVEVLADELAKSNPS